MNRVLKTLVLAILMLSCAGMTAWAEPEPSRLVEVFLKPGVDFKQFKTMAASPSVSFKPDVSWSIDKDDPFYKLRIQSILEKSIKRQGFILADAVDADLKLKLSVRRWGRLRSTHDLNLMEYLDVEAKVYAVASGDMLMRATGKYERVDPLENTPDKMNAAFESRMDEILGSLRPKPEKKDEQATEPSSDSM